jgi:hypothetical protein
MVLYTQLLSGPRQGTCCEEGTYAFFVGIGTRSPFIPAVPVTGTGSVKISVDEGGPLRFLAVSFAAPVEIADAAIPRSIGSLLMRNQMRTVL